ncbi:MAG: hypothetical protein SFT92_02850 [Rickettsiales bacterium]|nr:hypothetical protein [Rickettsiales bacterium]
MNQTIILSCGIFLLFLLLLPTNPDSMFNDPDTWWHVAAGDVIRQSGTIPTYDPWSFSGGSTAWINVAWSWDVAASYFFERASWFGLIAINSVTIALVMALVFALCFIHSRHGIASFITVLFIAAGAFEPHIRPFEISYLLIALCYLLLRQINSGRLSPAWLIYFPPIMILWVNIHGLYIIALFLLGVYGLENLQRKNMRLFGYLFLCGVASLTACLLNPFGIDALLLIVTTLSGSANSIINEWNGLHFDKLSIAHVYWLLFLVFIVKYYRSLPLSDKLMGIILCVMATLSIRHIPVFALLTAPLMTIGIRDLLVRKTQEPPTIPAFAQTIADYSLRIVTRRATAVLAVLLCLGASVALTTPAAAKWYDAQDYVPEPDLSKEVAFLKQHYPKRRLLNTYGLGGPLIFYGRGSVPVWIDGRVETAYPDQVVKDFAAYFHAKEGWESILTKYGINGAILDKRDTLAIDRFKYRQGWKQVFESKNTVILMKEKP